jgi:glycosyltransferase involved in cell wall biosynthesis
MLSRPIEALCKDAVGDVVRGNPTVAPEATVVAPAGAALEAFEPIRIVAVEVAEPLAPLRGGESSTGAAYRRGRVLVLLHGVPVGVVWIDFDSEMIEPRTLASVIVDSLGAAITEHLRRDGLQVEMDAIDAYDLVEGLGGGCVSSPVLTPDAPMVSVVLATCGRPDSLPSAIDALLHSDHPNFELVVVDNLPSDPRTVALVTERYADDARVRLVTEPRPGLSCARNRGMSSARGDIVAFTDDDVMVHPMWLTRIAGEFDDARVGAVTGLVEPAQLETLSQWWFECAAGFGRGMQRNAYHLTESPDPSPLFPYKLGVYGTGASMALRKSAMPEGWAFDEALGAGSATQGGEDIDLFLDVLTGGGVLVYQPAALSFHTHRADHRGLRKQMRGYGRGLTALLTKRLLRRPAERRLLLTKIFVGVRHALSPDFRKSASPHAPAAAYPRSLILREVAGMVQGPLAYWIGSRRRHRAGR